MTSPLRAAAIRSRRALALWSSILIVGCAPSGGTGARRSADAAVCVAPSPKQGARDASSPSGAQTQSTYDQVTERELTFRSSGSTLRGTITLPERADAPRAAQLPGVVILHDWGRLDQRGSTRGALGMNLPVTIHLYEQLAHALARRGVAVLRFDKRGCQRHARPSCTYQEDDLKPFLPSLGTQLGLDAAAALDALRAEPQVDPTRVAAIGHGQGAEVALDLIQSAAHPPGALVLLSLSMSPIQDVIAHQTSYSLRVTEAELKRQPEGSLKDELRQQLAALREDQLAQTEAFTAIRSSDEASAPAELLGLPYRTWRDFNALHERALTALDSPRRPPVMAILGAIDAELPEDNPRQLTEALAGATSTRVELLAETTHDMILVGEEQEGEEPEPPRVHPTLEAQISAFLFAHL